MAEHLRKFRSVAIVISALGLALAMVQQSVGTIASRNQPQLALQVDPNNSDAMGKYAFLLFGKAVEDGEDVAAAAHSVKPLALRAYRYDRLDARALSLLAMGQKDEARKQAILDQALKLNRRSLKLQALALQSFVAEQNLPRAVEILDQLLRVHPERREEFFPVLAQALQDKAVVPRMAEILASRPPWQDPFLRFAAKQQLVVENVSELRRRVETEDPFVDAQLITNLARFVGIGAAREHYDFVVRERGIAPNTKWSDAFPPFDWSFADDRNLRAQISRNGEEVELFVRSGAGGRIMERSFERPAGTLFLDVETELAGSVQEDNLRMQIVCLDRQQIIFDQPLGNGESRFPISSPLSGCNVINMRVYARVFRGQPALRGSIRSLALNPG
ncbi:MAG: hypothetical protein ABJG26_14790 [Marinomonas sp.]